MGVIKTLSALVAILLGIFSVFAIIVDGVAIIFAYISLVFAAIALGGQHKVLLKIVGVIFLLAHLVLGWRISSDSSHQGSQSFYPHNSKLFVKCSNEMFERMNSGQLSTKIEGNKDSTNNATISHDMKKWLDECYDN